MGDHGGIIVAVRMYRADAPTTDLVSFPCSASVNEEAARGLINSISIQWQLYTTDEGKTWYTHKFVDEPMRIYGLITEPGENTTVFTLFGSKSGSSHQWVIVTVDFKSAFGKFA